MPKIVPTKREFNPLPTETEDGMPRYLLAQMATRIEDDTYPGAPAGRKKLNVEFSIQEPDLKDRKAWKSYGLTISHSTNTKRVSDLTNLIIALDPEQTRETLDDGYDTDLLNGKLVKIRVEDYIKQNGEPGQKVIEVRPAKKGAKALKTEKKANTEKAEAGIDY